jgi:hypothetical protein
MIFDKTNTNFNSLNFFSVLIFKKLGPGLRIWILIQQNIWIWTRFQLIRGTAVQVVKSQKHILGTIEVF